MNNIKILESGSYFPKRKVNNEELENQLELQQGYIYKRTGIKERYYSKEETIDEIAIKAVENLFSKQEGLNYNIGLIIVATTTTNYLMPGIANKIQKELGINKCICLDILSGCAGFINAFDIAKLYLNTNKIERALVIGVENLSKYIDKKDISTSIILSDGAGAILLEKNKKNKKYLSNIEAIGKNNEILTYK